MATIGTLAAKVVADTSGFTMGMTSVRKELAETQRAADVGDGSLSGFGSSFIPVAATVTAGLAAITGAAYGVSRAAEEGFNRIQEIGNAAQSLAISVREFQVLTVAASDADVELETLTKGLYELQKSLAAGGSAKKSIDALGLSFEDIRNMSPQTQFAEIAEAINNIGDRSTRVKVVADLFGKAGFELQRLFDGGSEAIEDATKKLDRMGAITEKDVRRIGEWDSAWKELKGTLGGIMNSLASEIAPAMKEMVEMFTEFVQSAAGRRMVENFIDNVAGSIRAATTAGRMALTVLDKITLAIGKLQPVIDWWNGFSEGIGREAIGGIVMADVVKQIQDAERRQQMLEDGLADDAKDIRDPLADDAKKLLDSLRTPFQVIEDRIKHFRMLADLGYIGEGDFDKLTADAIDDLRAPPKQEFKNQAMAFGSQSAIQFLANQKYGDPNKATWDAMRKALDQIAKNTKPQKEAGPAVVPAF